MKYQHIKPCGSSGCCNYSSNVPDEGHAAFGASAVEARRGASSTLQPLLQAPGTTAGLVVQSQDPAKIHGDGVYYYFPAKEEQG